MSVVYRAFQEHWLIGMDVKRSLELARMKINSEFIDTVMNSLKYTKQVKKFREVSGEKLEKYLHRWNFNFVTWQNSGKRLSRLVFVSDEITCVYHLRDRLHGRKVRKGTR